MFKLAIWNSRDFISLRLLLRQKWKNTHCTQNEKKIALVSWSVWHLPLLTFVFCGFSLTAVGKVKSQLFYITQSPTALILTTGWDGNHLQDVLLTIVSGDVCVKRCARAQISYGMSSRKSAYQYLCAGALLCAHSYVCAWWGQSLWNIEAEDAYINKWVLTLVLDLEQWGLFLYTHHHWHVLAYLTSCHLQHCSLCAIA